MAENGELMAEIRTQLALNREERRQAIAFYEEQRREMRAEVQVMREVIRRNELAFQENSRVLTELVETVRAMKEGVRAQTRSIFKMIDRLDGGTAPA
jgi:hypothetical protein